MAVMAWLLVLLPLAQAKKDDPNLALKQPVFATLHIPRLEHRPTLEDFLDMQPAPAFADKMLKVEGFIQRDPKDGAPASQKTEVYLGYTDKNLYVVCICFESEPNKIRARMGRREAINDDDQFGFVLDTFHDRKHGVFFYLNPLGVQQDGIWRDNQEPDYSYDMVWNSDAKLTGRGYVAWFEIPFKQLRFPSRPDQTWGLFFERDVKRNNEYSFYPHITSNAQGFLAQETEMDGLEKISPGRNLQFIPYLSVRSFHELDDRDPNNPHFHGKHVEPRPGLDSKIVLKDALVLDSTINPDFSQVESDQPQITVNQRFEVFFPEKRPFFLENASFFRELSTAPGESECTDNRCLVGSNRVGGIDAKIKFNSKWSATLQALASHTKLNDGTHKGGSAYDYYLERSSTKLEYNVLYQDTAPNFETDTGFFRRPDVRRFSQFAMYRFRRKGKLLQWHGPSLFTINNWDHSGTRLEWFGNVNYRWILAGQTDIGVYYNLGHERLRPVDFDTLTTNYDYAHVHRGFFFDFGYFKPLSLGGEVNWGTDTNFDTAVGPPVLAKSSFAQIFATVRPVRGLIVENTYLLTRLRDLVTDANIFNDHIIRSKWNYQFSRALSLRLIAQYNTVLTNPALSSLQPAKNFNADVLLTYLVHPGTAVYVGYNNNLQNLDPSLGLDPDGNLLRTRSRFLNDGRQFFVKISYRFQY